MTTVSKPGFTSHFMAARIETFVFALIAWVLLLMRFGYEFGGNDHIELLPYILHLADNTLYTHDFYVQGMQQVIPNERYLVALALTPFVNYLQEVFLILHLVSTILLITGLEALGRMLIKNRWLVRLGILAGLLVFYLYTLGAVELYYNQFQASNLAKGLGIWAIVLFMRRRYWWAIGLTAFITFIQLIVGLNLMIAFGLLLIILWLKDKQPALPKLIGLFSLYAFSAGVLLVTLFLARESGTATNPQQFFDIVIEFRHPHHFLISHFPLRALVFFTAVSLFAVWYLRKAHQQLFYFMLIGLAGIVVYAIAVSAFKLVLITGFQWYKMTIWMKMIGIFAGIAWLEKQYLHKWKIVTRTTEALKPQTVRWMFVLCLPLVIVAFYASLYSTKGLHAQPKYWETVKGNTPQDAVFIQPVNITDFKYWSQRSSYIDFKANVRTPGAAAEWYRRLQLVYGLDMEMNAKGFELEVAANDHFYMLSMSQLMDLKAEGVTHLLTDARAEYPDLEEVITVGPYTVFKL